MGEGHPGPRALRDGQVVVSSVESEIRKVRREGHGKREAGGTCLNASRARAEGPQVYINPKFRKGVRAGGGDRRASPAHTVKAGSAG